MFSPIAHRIDATTARDGGSDIIHRYNVTRFGVPLGGVYAITLSGAVRLALSTFGERIGVIDVDPYAMSWSSF